MVLLYHLMDYAPSRYLSKISTWTELWGFPAYSGHFYLPQAQDSQMPKAELNISLTTPLQLSQAHWAILNDKDFPKAGGVFFSTTKTLCRACISKQKEQSIHDGESWLSHSLIFKPEGENAWDVQWEKRKKKRKKNQQRDKRSQNLSAWLRSTIDNLQGSILPFPCTERGEQLQFSWFERAPSLPPREAVKRFRAPHPTSAGGPAGSWQLPAPPQPQATRGVGARGVHTFLRQRAGLSLCPPLFQPPLCCVPPGTAELKLSGSTKGISTQVHPHWQRTCGCMRRAGTCTHN